MISHGLRAQTVFLIRHHGFRGFRVRLHMIFHLPLCDGIAHAEACEVCIAGTYRTCFVSRDNLEPESEWIRTKCIKTRGKMFNYWNRFLFSPTNLARKYQKCEILMKAAVNRRLWIVLWHMDHLLPRIKRGTMPQSFKEGSRYVIYLLSEAWKGNFSFA